MKAPLLQVKDLSVDFGKGNQLTNAVSNISFNIYKGEITAIVGESGSGKSVTALSIMKLLPTQASIKGELIFQQHNNSFTDLTTMSVKAISSIRGKDIAMIFQEPMTSLNPVLTCGSQVMEALKLHEKISNKEAKTKTIALFEQVQLPDPGGMLNRFPHQLSGGQKQRVMIAMAMSCNPSLLIADEPTTALDVTVQKTILTLIKQLQVERGMSVLLITHDLGLVADIAHHVIVMYKGKIVEQGNASDLLNNPTHAYTRALLACRPANHHPGERLPVVKDFLQANEILPAIDSFKKPIHAVKETLETRQRVIEDSSPVLVVEHLKVFYARKTKLTGKKSPGFTAVDDVSFTINKGETVGLVGESGCGKTTLGRAILQLIKSASGKIILNGVNLAGVNKKAMEPLRKDLQIVFQDPYGSLNPRLTIGAAIIEPMKVHGILNSNQLRRDKVYELLEKVNLDPAHFHRYPHEFSGGQRQRVCIARALALNPSFLIFDESVSALDVSVQAQVLNLLNDLKNEFNFTAIFISHDLSVVHYISDRIMVMHKGKIVETGLSDQVYFSPQHEYTRSLINAIPGKQIRLHNM